MVSLSYKRCSKCGETDIKKFSKNKSQKDGLNNWCKLCCSKKDTQWQEKNSWYGKKWRKEHPDYGKEKSKEWRKQHPEINNNWKEKLSLWASLNPDRVKLKISNWSKKNKDKRQISKINRRSRKKQNGGIITSMEWANLKEKYNYTCLCCGRKEPQIKLSLDHVIPLVSGGMNVIENAQPLCINCNSSKGKKTIDYR